MKYGPARQTFAASHGRLELAVAQGLAAEMRSGPETPAFATVQRPLQRMTRAGATPTTHCGTATGSTEKARRPA